MKVDKKTIELVIKDLDKLRKKSVKEWEKYQRNKSYGSYEDEQYWNGKVTSLDDLEDLLDEKYL